MSADQKRQPSAQIRLAPVRERPWLVRYGAAIAAVGVVFFVRWGLLWNVLGPELPFTLFLAAVLFAAWFGGFGPGVVAMVLSTLTVVFFLVEPRFELTMDDPRNAFEFAVFIGTSSAMAFCLKWLRTPT